MFLAMLGLSLVGVVMILAAIGIGRFAGAWTFLYPLPARSMGVWGPHAAGAFVGGLVFIGVGFLLFYLDCAATAASGRHWVSISCSGRARWTRRSRRRSSRAPWS
jgi:heme/copper-type cytochrome/quinol oxidase subunit 1